MSKDNITDFKVDVKDVSLLEAVLIDPETGGLMKVQMENDLRLDNKFVEYVKEVIDLTGI